MVLRWQSGPNVTLSQGTIVGMLERVPGAGGNPLYISRQILTEGINCLHTVVLLQMRFLIVQQHFSELEMW